MRKLTEHTETDPAALRRILKDVRAKGYAAIQDELDYGIVSVALPIFGPHGRIVAAANCSDVTNRLDRDTMIKKRLPVLRQAVRRIEGMLTQHPELTQLRGVDRLGLRAHRRAARRRRSGARRFAPATATLRHTKSRGSPGRWYPTAELGAEHTAPPGADVARSGGRYNAGVRAVAPSALRTTRDALTS